jgi:hypothetical protein
MLEEIDPPSEQPVEAFCRRHRDQLDAIEVARVRGAAPPVWIADQDETLARAKLSSRKGPLPLA